MPETDRVREALKTLLTTDMTGGTEGGLMLAEQMNKFIDLTLEYSTMLKVVRNEKKRRHSGEMDTMNVGSVVTEGATEAPGDGTSPDEEQLPTFGKIEYTMKKNRSMFNISTETLLDNIESEAALFDQQAGLSGDDPPTSFRDTLMRGYAKRITTDLELQAIKGDASQTATSTKTQRLIKQNDGWHVLTATGCHYVDCAFTSISTDLFSAMLEALPAPYLQDVTRLRWFMGPRTMIRWNRLIVDRATDLGDKVLQGETAAPFGIPIVMCPLIPEDLSFDDGTTTSSNNSFIWLTFPENFIYVIRRYVETYWEFVPRRDRWENTTYTETDYAIENKDAIVKAINMKVDASTAYSA